MYILRISNISKKFKIDDNKERIALDRMSLMFPSNGLISIVGKSGSGKSTLLNILSLMDEPTNGVVYYMNKRMDRWNNRQKEKYRNKEIGHGHRQPAPEYTARYHYEQKLCPGW